MVQSSAAQIKVDVKSQSLHQIWINCLLPLSRSQTLAFDRHRNIIFFQVNQTREEEKRRENIQILSCVRNGEEITRAILGNLNIEKST